MPAGLKSVRLHPEAQVELEESVVFYRERAGDQWAQRFKRRVEEAFLSIQADPGRYPEISKFEGVRKLRVTQFPFAVLFIIRPAHIWIVAIAHGSRRPNYWKQRL